MAKPLARVLALLDILQTGGTRTLRELSERLGVDERTVRRYADHLLDLDVPVESVRGRYGGYRLASGYRMPPLMLSDEEALAVLLGLVAGRRAGLMTATGTAGETAAAKIRRVLPEEAAADADPQAGRWLRVDLRAERLDWVPAVLASLDRPFVIERPDE